MTHEQQCEAFIDSVTKVIYRYKSEFDLNSWELLGLMHTITMDLAETPINFQADIDLEDEDEDDLGGLL